MRIPDHRSVDPMNQPRAWRERAAGVRDQQDTSRSLVGVERYRDPGVSMAQPIAYEAPNAGSDQTVTSTSFTRVTGSEFAISLAGSDDATWLVSLTGYRVVIQSTDAADTDVFATILVDWGNGTWVRPDVDLDSAHGLAQAYSTVDYAESVSATGAFSLSPTAVFRMRGGGTVKVAAAVRIGTAGQSATVNLTGSERTPQCTGSAVPLVAVKA